MPPQVRFASGGKDEEQLPPFRLTFPLEEESADADALPATTKPRAEGGAAAGPSGRDAGADGGAQASSAPVSGDGGGDAPGASGGSGKKKELVVESYVPPDPGPYPEDKPRTNSVRFTPVQTEAIMSGARGCLD